jgi:double stranded RNA-specific editase B
MEVICITTGTKSFHNNSVTSNGQLLNDCHAEIIARRCLIRYLYEQIKFLIDGQSNESIFEIIQDNNRFRLRSSIHFHLYISKAPCGDSRIFSLQDISSEKLNQELKKSRGLLGTKIKFNDGTIPVLAKTIYQNIQTWDGILDNERCLSMSCSDKLCRWNFIGLQGKRKNKSFIFNTSLFFLLKVLY